MLNSKTNFIGRVLGIELNEYDYTDTNKNRQSGRNITMYLVADNSNPSSCGVQVLTIKIADNAELRNKIDGAVLPSSFNIDDLKKSFLDKTVHVIQSYNATYGRYRPEYISVHEGG